MMKTLHVTHKSAQVTTHFFKDSNLFANSQQQIDFFTDLYTSYIKFEYLATFFISLPIR